ncbi:MAG TPA: TonB-dependent receptor, partial [Pyrinomonadaceae bacterium]|nr:TonB-dependent receptor [Pyrinomonadaceae bacterium]
MQANNEMNRLGEGVTGGPSGRQSVASRHSVRLLLCTALVTCFGASAAMAQEAAADATAPQSGLTEIVVTAQKRAESVQKSSVAIEVLGGEELQKRGITEVRDLTTAAPSVTISQNGGYVQTNIRGVGDFTNSALQQSAVSYSVDGAVIGQANGISENFFDLQRVEVLKGPQGTLYGRNATGGAVNIITRRPTQELGGYLTAEYGNYDSKKVSGALNVPLSPDLAVRGAFQIQDRDGYLSDGTDDAVSQAGRLQLYWKPSDNFDARISGSYSHVGGKGGGAVLWPRQPGTGRWTAASDPINNAAVAATTFGFQNPFVTNSFMDLDQWALSAEVNVGLGDFATLTVIPTYRNVDMTYLTNTIGFVGLFDPKKSEQTSVEVRLGNQSNRLKWTVGAFYYNEKTREGVRSLPLAEPNFIQVFNVFADITSKVKSYAVFGDATFGLTDSLRVIGGIRYTHDPISFSGTYEDLAVVPAPGSPFPQNGNDKFNKVTWRAGVEFDVGPQSMAYFTASTGYKAGGFFYSADPTDFTFKPENLTAFDFGIRNRFLDNKLQVNVEAFYWKYRDQQFTAVNYTTGGTIAYLTRNAGAGDPRGAAIDVVYQPTPHDRLGFNLAYTDAKYKDFNIEYPTALAAAGILRTGPLCSVGAPFNNASGNSVVPVDCSGAPMPRTPKWAGTANYEHVFPIDGAGELAFNASATWSSSRYLTADFYLPELKTGGYVLANASLTYTSEDQRWSITAFGNNLTNKAVYQGGFSDAVNGFG